MKPQNTQKNYLQNNKSTLECTGESRTYLCDIWIHFFLIPAAICYGDKNTSRFDNCMKECGKITPYNTL